MTPRATRAPHLVPVLALVAIALLLAAPAALAHDEPTTEIAGLTQRLATTRTANDLLRRAELYRLTGDWVAAERDLKQVQALASRSPDLPLAWAALDLDRGWNDSARHRIVHVLEHRPNDTQALLLAARIATAMHDDAQVAQLLERVILLIATPSPDLFLQRAAALRSLGDPEMSLRVLEAGIERLGPVTELTLAAARIEARGGHLDGGLDRIERLAPQFERREPIHAMRQELVALAVTGAHEPAGTLLDDSNHLRPAPKALPAPASIATATARPQPPPRQLITELLVPFGATWRYDTTGVSLGSAWLAPGYSDAAWPQGPGPLGFGETYIATPVKPGPDASTRYPTLYFRTEFIAPAAGSAYTSLTLNINYDDGFVAYLSGVEIARRGIVAGAVNYATLAASHEADTPEVIGVTSSLPLLVAGANVLEVEVHQTSLTSTDLVLDAELRADTTPLLTRGPYLQLARPTGIVIRWRTNPASGSAVRFGTATGARDMIATDPTVTTEHEVELSGLQPDTRYWYTPATLAEPLATDTTALTFVTPPLAGTPKPTRFWIIGDSGVPGPNQNAVRDAYVNTAGAHPADLWLMLGDNAYTVGTDSDYTNGVFVPYRDILKTTALWTTRGNHDVLYAGPANDYYELFTLPTAGEAGGLVSGTESYYSFDYGDIHVVCLDSEGGDLSPGGAMMLWLANDLAATLRKWRIAFWHHPPYTRGSHNSDNLLDSGGRMANMRANALPILEAAGIDLVLGGHSHSYERSGLLDEHYGDSSTLADSMRINAGDGRPGGNGAYEKPSPVLGPHEGTVYSVVGSSAQISGGLLNHAAMKVSLNVLGSMILDIDGNRLEAQFIDNLGAVRDSFVILKGMTGPHTITATAQPGGAITPGGALVVPTNGVQAYMIAPDAPYGVVDVLVDGITKGPLAGWTFKNVQANHSIEARFAPAAPALKSIRDLPSDQGGSFAVQFRRSSRENAASAQPVTAYEAYRATTPMHFGAPQHGGNSSEAVWEQVATLPATGDSVYSVAVPSLADSGSAATVPYTTFYIGARTASTAVFWDSAVDSGYSVDNLAPAAPQTFARTFQDLGVELRWSRSIEPDVVQYRVYRDTLDGFTPSPATLLASTPDTVFIDDGSRHHAYALQAIDRNANAGAFIRIQPDVVGVRGFAPGSLWLGNAVPNPTPGRTRITFALPRPAHTQLTVFDVSGRVIRHILDGQRAAGVHSETWDGRDDFGHAVPNAIYFYELAVEGRVMTGRLVKLS